MSGASTVVGTGQPVRVLPENPLRKRLLLQVISGGNAWYNGASANPAVNQSLKIATGNSYFDDPPFVHCGEVWVIADAASTVVYVAEWV